MDHFFGLAFISVALFIVLVDYAVNGTASWRK